jgi:hypothetical protein
MKQKARKIKVAIASARICCRQAAHAAQLARSTGITNGTRPKAEMSENERYSTRSLALAPAGPIAHSAPEERTGALQIRPPTTKHHMKPVVAMIVESHRSCFMV